MNEICDRCGPGTRAQYCAERGDARLTFCGHCATRTWQPMYDQGWQFTPLSAVSAAPQLSAAMP